MTRAARPSLLALVSLLALTACRDAAAPPPPASSAPKPVAAAPAPPPAAPLDVAALAGLDDDARRRAAAALPPGTSPQAALLALAADAGAAPDARADAAWALAQYFRPGPDELPALRALLTAAAPPEVRAFAALASIAAEPATATETLAATLHAPGASTGGTRDHQVIAAVFLTRGAAQGGAAAEALAAARDSAHAGVRAIARAAAARDAQAWPDALHAELLALAGAPRPADRQAAAFALAMAPPERCDQSLPTLRALLDDLDAGVRSVAVSRFYFIGPCAPPALEQATRHPDGNVALAAVRSIVTRHPRPAGLDTALVALVRRGDSGVRCQALETLEHHFAGTPLLDGLRASVAELSCR